MFEIRFEISTEIAAVLKTAFEAIWTAPGRLLASNLDQNGVDFGPSWGAPGVKFRAPAGVKNRSKNVLKAHTFCAQKQIGSSYTNHPLVMTSVILSGGVKMRVEHGMLREVYIFCHDFCHTFRSSMECLGRYTFALCFFFAASFTASFAAFREALSFAASFAAFRQLLCHTLCAQKQIDKNTWFDKDNDNDNNNTRTKI